MFLTYKPTGAGAVADGFDVRFENYWQISVIWGPFSYARTDDEVEVMLIDPSGTPVHHESVDDDVFVTTWHDLFLNIIPNTKAMD